MKKRVVCIIGIGRVGLPLALVLADKGHQVYGISRNQEKIDSLNKGKMPFVEKGGNLLKKHVGKSLIITSDYSPINKSDILILTLGTPIDENMNPVLDQLNSAIENMIPYLRKGQIILLRSTVSPNTTIYAKDQIEIATKFKIGRDIFLAFCPERIAQGNSIKEIMTIPQIIGGIDDQSTQKAKQFFEDLGIKCFLTDSTTAELTKLFTNMYRYISFAIANEFMVLAESFDKNIHEIVDLVNRDYKRGGLALPGLTAGPCLFKDGFFLINENPFLDLITASWKINESLPLFLVKKVKEKVDLKGKKVLILGLGFKPETDDIRESLSFKIRKSLLREHAIVVLHDPFVKNYSNQIVLNNLEQALTGIDVVFIATRHNLYNLKKRFIMNRLKKSAYICDIWNTYKINKLVFTANDLHLKPGKARK